MARMPLAFLNNCGGRELMGKNLKAGRTQADVFERLESVIGEKAFVWWRHDCKFPSINKLNPPDGD